MSKEIRIILPERVYVELKKVEEKTGIRLEDLITRSIVKVIEEFRGE